MSAAPIIPQILVINSTSGLKTLKETNFIFSEVNNINSVYIPNTDPNTSNITFIRSINYDYGDSNLPASATYNYKVHGSNTSSTGSVTALYEFLRGYLYRDVNNNNVSALPTLVSSKSSSNSITGFRLIIFDKNIKFDMIKPNSFRMSVMPNKIIFTTPDALYISNSGTNVSDSSSGAYTSITEQNSLSGSLSAGVSGSVLTGFTILMKIKPDQGGAENQTLFHRRVADKSLTSIGALLPSPGINNAVCNYKYGDLNPLSANITSTGTTFYTIYSNYSSITSLSSTPISISNIGGGHLNWGVSSNASWLSISGVTGSTIIPTNNLISNIITITAYANGSVTSLTIPPFHSSATYVASIKFFYNESLRKSGILNIPFSVERT